jgi:hypothetical protein
MRSTFAPLRSHGSNEDRDGANLGRFFPPFHSAVNANANGSAFSRSRRKFNRFNLMIIIKIMFSPAVPLAQMVQRCRVRGGGSPEEA